MTMETSLTDSVAEPVAGWISCPRCSRRARAGQGFCELCGLRLHDEDAAAPPGATAELVRRTFHCDGCGADVRVPQGERTATCAFCGVPYVRAGETSSQRHAPEFVLPFTVTRRQAEDAYGSWLGRAGWLAPRDLRAASILGELRGVYIPFWSFTMRSESAWRARIGETWYETVHETYTTTVNGKLVTRTRTRRVAHTEWYPLEGRFHQFHADHLVPASRGLPQGLADGIRPFPVSEAVRYAPRFLAGWLCEEYTLPREEAERLAEEEFRRRERTDIGAFLPGDTSEGLEVSTTFNDRAVDLMLLPLWILAYGYRGRTYRCVINGATGALQGQRPTSGARVALAVAIVVLLLALLAILGVLAASLARGGP